MAEDGRRSARQGIVLVLCVLLLLALELLAHGALLMAREEFAVSRAGADLLRARAAADAGLVDMMAAGAPAPPDTLGSGVRLTLVTVSLGAARYRVSVRRLSREIWLVESEGAVRPGVWVEQKARPAWSMDPTTRIGAFRGVVEIGPNTSAAGLSRVWSEQRSPTDPRPSAQTCARWARARDSLGIAPILPPMAVVDTAGGREPTFGPLDVTDLLQVADHRVAGTGTPGPGVGASGCLKSEPWNWGDPDDPPGACRELAPVIGAAGSLRVEGGRGQGVLVVAGDLTLTAGARFYGVALVGGALTVTGGARLTGLARAAGGLTVDPSSEVDGSACWAFQALSRTRTVMGGLRPLPGVGTIAPLGDAPG